MPSRVLPFTCSIQKYMSSATILAVSLFKDCRRDFIIWRLLPWVLPESKKQTQLPLKRGEMIHIVLPVSAQQLDAVVVTAEKEESNIQTVPVSITALSSRDIDAYRLWSSKELKGIVSNMYAADPGDGRNVISIRGITSTSYDPAVVTYIDGVPQFTLDTYIPQLFDIDHIDVLKGPQGTLYGRNALGGVVNIVTKKPDNQFHGSIDLSAGDHGLQRYSFQISAPLINGKLFLGVAGLYEADPMGFIPMTITTTAYLINSIVSPTTFH